MSMSPAASLRAVASVVASPPRAGNVRQTSGAGPGRTVITDHHRSGPRSRDRVLTQKSCVPARLDVK